MVLEVVRPDVAEEHEADGPEEHGVQVEERRAAEHPGLGRRAGVRWVPVHVPDVEQGSGRLDHAGSREITPTTKTKRRRRRRGAGHDFTRETRKRPVKKFLWAFFFLIFTKSKIANYWK